jgi:hypothetical protein
MGWIAFAALEVYIGLIILEALIPRFQLKSLLVPNRPGTPFLS